MSNDRYKQFFTFKADILYHSRTVKKSRQKNFYFSSMLWKIGSCQTLQYLFIGSGCYVLLQLVQMRVNAWFCLWVCDDIVSTQTCKTDSHPLCRSTSMVITKNHLWVKSSRGILKLTNIFGLIIIVNTTCLTGDFSLLGFNENWPRFCRW